MENDIDPKGKGYLLLLHILDKGFQAGSLIGALLVGPSVSYRLGRRGEYDLFRRYIRVCGTSALVGTALAGTAERRADRMWKRRIGRIWALVLSVRFVMA